MIDLVAKPSRRDGAVLGTQLINGERHTWRLAFYPCGGRRHVYGVCRYNPQGKHTGTFTPDGLGFRRIADTIGNFQASAEWLASVSVKG